MVKDPMERMGDRIDALTNENAELKERVKELEAENARKECTLNTYRRTYNVGWK